MPTRLSSVAIRARAGRAQPSGPRTENQGSASRHMVDKDETKPVTGTSDGSVSPRRGVVDVNVRIRALRLIVGRALGFTTRHSLGLLGPGSER